MTDTTRRSRIGIASWRDPQHIDWTFHNVREFVPTATITEGIERGDDGPGDAPLRAMRLERPDGAGMSAVEHLVALRGDCFVAMRDGEILAEWSAPHASTVRPHILFSVSKSVTGMLAGIAVGEGVLDPEAAVARYMPVRPGGAYETARVRDLLDMTVSLDFVEDYLDMDGDFDRYRRSTLWNPERPGTAHETMQQVIASLPALPGPHGRVFAYASPNTDMLGLVLEQATGRRFCDYLGERLWRPMGARGPAYATVDRAGAARAAGGLCVTARDLARFGQLVLDGGSRGGQPLIPAAWIDDMRRNGNRQAWIEGNAAATFPAGRYRSCWYQTGSARDLFAGIGIHGQRLLVDPVSRVVLVKLSSWPQPSDDAATMLDVHMLAQIAARL